MLSDELTGVETFDDMWKSTLGNYFGQSSQIFYHVVDASSISQEVWTHNDFPYEKFLTNEVDVSVLNWKPTRFNPSPIYGSVMILNAEGDVENCVVTSGGTIMGSDEETLRQIEVERKRKLQRKEFNAELLEQAQIQYLLNRDLNEKLLV